MKAVTTPKYGPPEVLQITRRPTPRINADEFLVEVAASAVTEGDRRLRSADFPGISALPGRLMMGVSKPRHEIQGTQYAGRVIEVGASITRFQIGDRVFGSVEHGAYAELTIASEKQPVAIIPERISFEAAASVPYGAITALHFLRDAAQVQPDEHVLVIGASGGVGQYAVQVAKSLGAKVTGVSSAKNMERVASLGADVVLDYRADDFLYTPASFDVIFDISGTTGFWQTTKALRPKGRYLTLLVSGTVLLQMAATAVFSGKRALFDVALGTAAQMEDVANLIAAGDLQPTVGSMFQFDDIIQAHLVAQERRSEGTVIVLNQSLK